MKSELRNIELNIHNLGLTKEFYKVFFTGLGYIILEEDNDHIKFRALNDDFTFYNSTDEINYNEVKDFSIRLNDKNLVNSFYENFIKKNNLETLPDSSFFQKENKVVYEIKFKDPNNLIWKIYTDNESNAVIKQELRKNFTKEFIYSFLLFPYGLVYAYNLFFRYKHKLAGVICLLITIATLAFYIYAIFLAIDSFNQVFGNVNEINNQIKLLNGGINSL